MTNLLFNIVEQFNLVGLLEDDKKSEILRILLFRHRYMDGEHHQGVVGGIRRNLSWKHMVSKIGFFNALKEYDMDFYSSGFLKREQK